MMKSRVVLIILLLGFCWQVQSQDLTHIDREMAGIPLDKTTSTDKLSAWITESYSTDKERVTAIFVWLARNISYDVTGMYNTQYYKSDEEAVTKTLGTREGVCQGYAAIFHELCQKMNIPAWTITGYTRQFGKVVPNPHAWNAVMLDQAIYLYDPTWGAGYVMDGKYTANFNLDYFMRSPEQMRSSHLPFDPLWQFSGHPINPEDFDAGIFESTTSLYFNFADTLRQYTSLTPMEQSQSALRRIERNGLTNELVKTEAGHLRMEIKVHRQNQVISQMNAAVLDFNEGVKLYNQYISFKNKQFKPVKSDNALKSLIDSTMSHLLRAADLVHGLEGPESATNANIRQLEKSVLDMLKRAGEEKAFVSKYIAASPEMRKKMFYH